MHRKLKLVLVKLINLVHINKGFAININQAHKIKNVLDVKKKK